MLTSNESTAVSQLLAGMAGKWTPVLPQPNEYVDSETYYENFDLIVNELRKCAVEGSVRSTSALIGQVLEFMLKVSLESAGVERKELSGSKGTLYNLIIKAQNTKRKGESSTILFNPGSLKDCNGRLDHTKLDQIPQKYLTQHSILQAREYRNYASHATPWMKPIDVFQAARQLAATITICETLSPSFPPPVGSSESSQIQELRDLRSRGVDLAVAFLPDRSINRVYELIIQLRREEGEAGNLALIDAVARNPTWLFARASATAAPEIRQLLQVLNAAGYNDLSHIAAVLLPINDLSLTHIVRRFGAGFRDHVMMARTADPNLFGRLLSNVEEYPQFVTEFCHQVLGTGDKGPSTVSKADYLAQGFANLPPRLRNRILIQLGDSGSLSWLRECKYTAGPLILRGITDAALARVPQLIEIRRKLRNALLEQIASSPPRYSIRTYLAFAHHQPKDFRQKLYEAILDSLKLYSREPEQEAASCRLLLEIILAVDRRGPIWVRSQSVAAVNGSIATGGSIRLLYSLIARGFDQNLDISDQAASDALSDLPELVERDALVAQVVVYYLNNKYRAEERAKIALSEIYERAAYIIRSHRATGTNVIDAFLTSNGWTT